MILWLWTMGVLLVGFLWGASWAYRISDGIGDADEIRAGGTD